MNGFKDELIKSLMIEIDEQTKKLHSLNDSETSLSEKHWASLFKKSQHEWHVENIQTEVSRYMLELTSPDINPSDKATSHKELSELVEELNAELKIVSELTVRTSQDLRNLHNEQMRFDRETCMLNGHTKDLLEALTSISFKNDATLRMHEQNLRNNSQGAPKKKQGYFSLRNCAELETDFKI